MTDAEIIKSVRNGDQEAFRELVKRYESRVAATVIGMLGPGPDAEDVGQDTFIRFYRHLDQYRGESSIATYLTRIAINLSLNALKRRKRQRTLFLEKPVDEAIDIPDPDATDAYDGESELVQQAIRTLEPKFRAVVVLRLMRGYTTKETADILKLPLGTVLSRLARAQNKLKEILSPYFGEGHG